MVEFPHVILDTRPSCFSCETLTSWEWPGDEAIATWIAIHADSDPIFYHPMSLKLITGHNKYTYSEIFEVGYLYNKKLIII